MVGTMGSSVNLNAKSPIFRIANWGGGASLCRCNSPAGLVETSDCPALRQNAIVVATGRK